MRVAFIGLGTMGSHLAANVAAAGHDLVVHDLRRAAAEPLLAAGARWADTCGHAAEDREVVLTSLPGPKDVEAVASGPDGLIAALGRVAATNRSARLPQSQPVWVDLSTNAPATVRSLHARCAEVGVAFLDAPVSGGPAGARTRKLSLWVGGDEAVYDRLLPLFEAIGDRPRYVGEIGAGSVAKLVHNCAGYAIQAALAEVFTMGVKAGVPPLALWGAIRQGAHGRRRTFDGLGEQFLSGSFDPPAFALRLAHKDVALATELGREVGVPMRIANLTLEEMTEALARGWGDRDSRVAMVLQEERAGLAIAEDRAAIDAVLEQDR